MVVDWLLLCLSLPDCAASGGGAAPPSMIGGNALGKGW